MTNISRYFTYEVVDKYDSTWGDHTGANVFLKAKPLADWYLFSSEGLGIEYSFSIDYIGSYDGEKYTYNNTGSTHFINCKKYDLKSAVLKFTRVKGKLIFIKKDAVISFDYLYDASIKRKRVSNCTLIKGLDEYMLENYWETGHSYLNFSYILQSFE